MSNFDLSIFFIYFISVAVYGSIIFFKRRPATAGSGASDFFLAKGSLKWWAIGASIIASNISAEQFVGMSGAGFSLGLGIATYEWWAGIGALIIVAVSFLPVYNHNHIETMPQFLAKRYDNRVSSTLSVFWLILYVVVNLTSILYLGALSLEKMTGMPFIIGAISLAIFAMIITLGGMRVIGYTDVIQVIFLILGGLATTYLAVMLVSVKVGNGNGIMEGLLLLREKAPEHFIMFFEKGRVFVENGQGGKEDAYNQLPGYGAFFGGILVIALNYWGCNQYITQRALGATIDVGRKGLLFAAFLKLLMPLIVVLPGIAAYVLFKEKADANIVNGMTEHGIIKPDNAYPLLLSLLPSGLKGLSFAALTAAIVASLAGKCNSISTIYVLDIHKKYINKNISDRELIVIGRVAIVISFIIALFICPQLKSFGQGFQYIQEYTGFISPGIFCIFLLGIFWKKANSNGALAASILSIPLSAAFKILYPQIPFINRVGYVFLACVLVMVIFAYGMPVKNPKTEFLIVRREFFKVSTSFVVMASILLSITAALYIVFW